MSQPPPRAIKAVEPDWETKYALKVGLGRVVFLSLVYAGWVGFLAYLAADRWLGSLY